MKIANHEARFFVQRQHPFQGSNLYGTYWCSNPSSIHPGDNGYVVYSYGTHWPLFVCVHLNGKDVWFENEERHSRTTSKHRSQTHPHCPTVFLSQGAMTRLVAWGFKAIAKDRVLGTQQTEFHQEVA